MDSLAALSFVASLTQDKKEEIFAVLNKELYPGEPLYDGKRSREIISSWTLELVRTTLDNENHCIELSRHEYTLYAHFVVATMIEDLEENLFYIRELMCDILFQKNTNECLEIVINMVLNTPATKKHHKKLKKMIKRYKILLDAKIVDQPLEWGNIPRDLADEISSVSWINQDIIDLINLWL